MLYFKIFQNINIGTLVHNFGAVGNPNAHLQLYVYTILYNCSTVLMSILVLMPLLGGTWILGLLFLIDSDSEPLAWIFTILNSLQVSDVLYIFDFYIQHTT